MSNLDITIGSARVDDAWVVHRLVCGLEAYQNPDGKVQATVEDYAAAMSGERRLIEALLAYAGDEAIGVAVHRRTYSTKQGREGLFLADMFVEEAYRSRGVGRALMAALSKIAVEQDCCDIAWVAGDWNTRGMQFYDGLDAERVTGDVPYSLHGDALKRLAEEGQE